MAKRKSEEAAELTWFALQVAPQKEFTLQKILKRHGYHTFVPVEHRWRRWNKFTKQKTRRSFPMMPRYVMVGFPFHDSDFHVAFEQPIIEGGEIRGYREKIFSPFQLPIVTGCVGVSGIPRALDTKRICEYIDRWPDGMDRPDREKWMPTGKEFKEGDMVRVWEGPLQHHLVKVIEINALNGKAKILAEMFGSQMEIEINVEKLEAA